MIHLKKFPELPFKTKTKSKYYPGNINYDYGMTINDIQVWKILRRNERNHFKMSYQDIIDTFEFKDRRTYEGSRNFIEYTIYSMVSEDYLEELKTWDDVNKVLIENKQYYSNGKSKSNKRFLSNLLHENEAHVYKILHENETNDKVGYSLEDLMTYESDFHIDGWGIDELRR